MDTGDQNFVQNETSTPNLGARVQLRGWVCLASSSSASGIIHLQSTANLGKSKLVCLGLPVFTAIVVPQEAITICDGAIVKTTQDVMFAIITSYSLRLQPTWGG